MSRITTTQKVLGFGTVLTDDYIFLSPAIGLLLSTAPHIVANSRRFPNYSKQSQFLANELFFQRYDKLSMRRYGPVTITKSRSKASYWLTTAQLGQLLGLALSSDAVKVSKNTIL